MEDTRIFEDVSYDLSQNIINGEIIRLDYQSLILCIGHFLKTPKIVENFQRITDRQERESIILNINLQLVEEMTKKIYQIITEHFGIEVDTQILNVNTTVRIVVDEVFLFLSKMELFSVIDLNIFVNNLVITSQGTVNTKKTVSRVLEQENLSNFKKFKLSTEFFLEKLVRKYYSDLEEMEKASIIRNLDADKDFSTYFWRWQIGKTREKIGSEKFFAYVPLKNRKFRVVRVDEGDDNSGIQYMFLKAVENQNEMAVEYLWTKYISSIKEKEMIFRKLFCEYFHRKKHINILMYLLLQVKKNETDIKNFIRNREHDIRTFLHSDQRFVRIRPKIIAAMEASIGIQVL